MTDIKKILIVWATVCGHNNLCRMLNDDLSPRGYVDLIVKLSEEDLAKRRESLTEELNKPETPKSEMWSEKFKNEYRISRLKLQIPDLEANLQRLKDYQQELE